MNKKSNLSNIVTIAICIILIIAVIFAKNFSKDKESKKGKTADKSTAEVVNDEENESIKIADSAKNQDTPTNPDLESYIDEKQLEKVDDSLYSEDAGDGYQKDGKKDINIWFTNIEVLEDAGVPSWIYTYINEKLQAYLNLNNYYSVGEITIDKESIKLDDKTCFFSIDLNNGRICTVNIDLEKQDFVFGDHKK